MVRRLALLAGLLGLFYLNLYCQNDPPSSQINKVTFHSDVLGIEKSFNIYLPPGYTEDSKRYPVLYLFRGHEDEWKDRGNIKEIADQIMPSKGLGEMIIVMPGLTFGDNFAGFPVNLKNPGQQDEIEGIGSGLYEDYMILDLIPYVDKNFKTIASRTARATDGFSAGAYSSLFLALRHPELFCSVGAYDPILGYMDFDIPDIAGELDDSVYMKLTLFDPYFGKPRDIEYMKQCNPANMIYYGSEKYIDSLKEIKFFILAASENGTSAYIEGSYYLRTKHFLEYLAAKGIVNYWNINSIILSPDADHNWRDAMVYIKINLPLHLGRLNRHH